MISAIRLLAVLISVIAAMAAPTTRPPRSACSRAATAISLACTAFPALFLTIEVICSIEEVVSTRLEACSSVRLLKSRLPREISDAPSCTAREVFVRLSTTSIMLWIMELTEAASALKSPNLLSTLILEVRSPSTARLTTCIVSATVLDTLSTNSLTLRASS